MSGKTVLYAEDEFTNRKIMEIQCRRFGIQCRLVEEGSEALSLAQQERFDLIILDQYMPGLNGDEVAKEIRKIDKETPLVAITSDDGCIRRLKEWGFDRVFVKPLRAADYEDLLKDYAP